MRLRTVVPLAAVALALAPSAAPAATFTVTSDLDTNSACAATCSLREAINGANATVGADTIAFAIPGGGTRTITAVSPLPDITQPLTIDGTTQTGYSAATGKPVIVVNGAGSTAGNGFTVSASSGTIKALTISGFSGHGILMQPSVNGLTSRVEACFIGTDANGTVDQGNGGSGVSVAGGGAVTIGPPLDGTGAPTGAGNLISGNNGPGITINRPGGSGLTQVYANIIGANFAVSGQVALPNSGPGIRVVDGTATIGNPSAGNEISGNGADGILLESTADQGNVSGNSLGLNRTGTAKIANADDGIDARNSNATIGANYIAGNASSGIEIHGSNHLISGNLVGTNVAGTAAVTGQATGVSIDGSGTIVGGPNSSDGNVVAAASGDGVLINAGNANTIDRNYIGTNAAGATTLGNGDDGVQVTSGIGNLIGTAEVSNTIANNGDDGVAILAGQQTIRNNFIGTNSAGTDLGNGAAGVRVTGGDSNIGAGGSAATDFNVISGNGGDGVVIAGTASGVSVRRNRIGTNPAATAALPNAGVGVRSSSGGNFIDFGNSIAGNGSFGVQIDGGDGTAVKSNVIGLNLGQTAALANGNDGVRVSGGINHEIGSAGQGNRVSGNTGDGIEDSRGIDIVGNLVGTNGAGTGALPNAGDGVRITDGGGNVRDNVLSGNSLSGLSVAGSGGVDVQGNTIGLGETGSGAVPNTLDGVFVSAPSNIVGGYTAANRNSIENNGRDGVELNGTNNTVSGNTIRKNGRHGVLVSAAPNVVGGTLEDSGNTITDNVSRGVTVTAAGNGVRVNRNAIYENGSVGIDLGDNGVTANDISDTDTGPNGLQNFPTLSSAVLGGDGMGVAGTLATNAFTTYRIELYRNFICDGSGNGQGARFVDAFDVTTNSLGVASFSRLIADAPVGVGDAITATATAANGSTSELGPCRNATQAPAASVNDAGSVTEGGDVTFTVTLSAASEAPAEVGFFTAGGTASATDDYTGTGGTLTFAPGETSKQVTVPTIDDGADEPAETFELRLGDERGARIGDGTGAATIADNDDPPAQQPPDPGQQQPVDPGQQQPADPGQQQPEQPSAGPVPPQPSGASAPVDADADGLSAELESKLKTSDTDRDSDDDGLADGAEDKNRNGVVDKTETSPAKPDTDRDRLGDGLELGLRKGVADPPGPVLGTDTKKFKPDKHPRSKTNPLKKDTDGDRKADGAEDRNRNGKVDPGERDPRRKGR